MSLLAEFLHERDRGRSTVHHSECDSRSFEGRQLCVAIPRTASLSASVAFHALRLSPGTTNIRTDVNSAV